MVSLNPLDYLDYFTSAFSDFEKTEGIITSLASNGIGFVIMIFKALFMFGYLSTAMVITMFGIVINIAPFLLSLGFFLVTNPFLILVFLECYILIRVILLKDPIDKIGYWFSWHKDIILFVFALPEHLLDIEEKIMVIYTTILVTIKDTSEFVLKIVEYFNNIMTSITIAGIPIGSAIGAIAFIAILAGALSNFVNF